MKIWIKFAAVACLLVAMGILGNFTVKADDMPDDTTAEISTEVNTTAESGILDETPMFQACLEYSPQGWIVKGSLKNIADDTILIQPMCSEDGETYRECGQEWSLQWLCSEDESELAKLHNQRCLYGTEEPLKSYLAKDLDRFYIKLRVVREGGIAYETQTAIIDRGERQPVPAGVNVAAIFAPCVFVREGRPPKIQYYGRYQITVSEDATEEEISAFLPDTLPVSIQLQKGLEYIGDDTIDCPVKWKPMKLPQLTAGESVIVQDAAEEIVIPAGSILNTQTGIFQLNESMGMRQYGVTDEVRLVLNVVAKDGQPAGALSAENYGLEMVFQLKPTGASSIRAYTIAEGGTEWTELSGLSLLDAVNAQPSTANSGYRLVLGKEQEPYRSYQKAKEAGEEPTPFFVGIKIEGGVYDGRQLVLAWPDTYELPLHLPEMGGSGGNEGNAGSDDKDDSTDEGQRPGLPHDPKDELTPEPSKGPEGQLLGPGLSKEPENQLLGPELSKSLEGQLPGHELPEGTINGEDSFRVQEKIPEIEMLENKIGQNEMHDITNGFFGQQLMAASMQSETEDQPAAETDDEEFEGETSDNASDTKAAIDTASSADVEDSARADIQKKPGRRTSGADSRVLFPLAACIAVFACIGMIASQRKAGVKIKSILRRYMYHKAS